MNISFLAYQSRPRFLASTVSFHFTAEQRRIATLALAIMALSAAVVYSLFYTLRRYSKKTVSSNPVIQPMEDRKSLAVTQWEEAPKSSAVIKSVDEPIFNGDPMKDVEDKCVNKPIPPIQFPPSLTPIAATPPSVGLKEILAKNKQESRADLEKRFSFRMDIIKKPNILNQKQDLTINLKGVKDLLQKYEDIFSLQDRTGGHTVGYWIEKTYQHGLPMFNSNEELNKDLIDQLTYILAYCAAEDSDKSKELLIELASGFTKCQPEQQREISRIYIRLTGIELTFKERIADQLSLFKEGCFDEMIFQNHPECVNIDDSYPAGQFPHIKSAYLTALGNEFGLKNTEEAALDLNRPRLSKEKVNSFRDELTNKLNEHMLDFIIGLTNEWNDKGINNNDEQFNTWIKDKACHSSFMALNSMPFFYEEDKEEDYILVDKRPNREQEEGFRLFFKPIEVLQMLKEMEFLA